jgi:hypothetical protein
MAKFDNLGFLYVLVKEGKESSTKQLSSEREKRK